MRLRRPLVPFFLTLLAGCPDDGGGTPTTTAGDGDGDNGGDGDGDGTSETGEPPCTSDDECTPESQGPHCLNGECVECVDDDACAVWCDTETNSCEPCDAPGAPDDVCGDGACEDGGCIMPCTLDATDPADDVADGASPAPAPAGTPLEGKEFAAERSLCGPSEAYDEEDLVDHYSFRVSRTSYVALEAIGNRADGKFEVQIFEVLNGELQPYFSEPQQQGSMAGSHDIWAFHTRLATTSPRDFVMRVEWQGGAGGVPYRVRLFALAESVAPPGL